MKSVLGMLTRRGLIATAAPAVLMAACHPRPATQTDSAAPPAPPPAQPTDAAYGLASATTALGEKLLSRLRLASPHETVLISPLCVMTTMLMLTQGAGGETLAELQTALDLKSSKWGISDAGAAYANIRTRLQSSTAATVAVANGLWAQADVGLRDDFVHQESTVFGARIASADLQAAGTLRDINGFVDQATGGKIPAIVDSLSAADVVVMVSALYFKGGWFKTFNVADTRAEPFTKADGTTVPAPLMRQSGRFDYAETPLFQSVILPYADVGYELILVLEKPGAPPEHWAEALHAEHDDVKGQVIIPRLNLNWAQDLDGALKALGLQHVFAPGADFSGMAAKPTYVDKIAHRTALVVDEQGAEAAGVATASASAAAMEVQPPKPFVFRADRPFHLVLRETGSMAPLFMAYVAAPLS